MRAQSLTKSQPSDIANTTRVRVKVNNTQLNITMQQNLEEFKSEEEIYQREAELKKKS